MPYRGYMHHDAGWGFGEWFLVMLLILLVVAVAAFLIANLTRARTAQPAAIAPAAGGADALEIVRLRYARGEIDREQYLQLSGDLAGP